MKAEKKKQNLSRKKIINSAIALFANKGFDSTSTRAICKHAGVNLSLIPYYFGNKEGLYTNIIESIVNFGLLSLQEEIAKAQKAHLLNKDEKIELYRALLEKYVNFLYSENVPNSFIILMIKEQTVSHTKFSDIYSQKIKIFYGALKRTLASILDKKENDKTITFEVFSLIGQILGLKLMDRATLDSLGQDFYNLEDSKKIKRIALSYIDSSIEKLTTQKTPALTI